MADENKVTDGPEPYSPSAFDFAQLPDHDNDFVNDDDFAQFAKALAAPETSPSTEDLSAAQPGTPRHFTAHNDWRPVHQRVRKRNKTKAAPRRGKDETREGFVYVLLKWPLLVIVLGWLLFLSIAYVFTRLYIYLYEHWVTWRGTRNRLRQHLQNATTYDEWIRCAKELDAYLGSDLWKEKPEYAYYDSKTVKRVHDQMLKLRQRAQSHENRNSDAKSPDGKNKAVDDLRALMEACIKNNFVGFENPRLYSETYYGTKDLVQHFVDEAATSMDFLLHTKQLAADNKRDLFKHLDSNFGRTALCLSGGATFAYYHYGLAKALLDANLLPDVITGTSGGALVAALLGTRTDEELKKLLVPALAHRIKASQDSTWTWMRRWYKTGARFDAVQWGKACCWMTRGSMTFKEAYQRTGRILNVSCVPSDPHSPTILANYITAPDCVIWSAVLASAAVPGILNPVVLMKKDKDGTLSPYSFGHKWKDGSLRTDIPLKALNLYFNVRFSIVSQVNPHINIFFFSSRGSVGRPVTHRRGRGWRGGFIGSAIEQYLKLDLNKWLKVLRHLELLPRPLGQDWSEIWLQRFSGTITIWPKSIPSDFIYILSDPTPERLARMIHVGQQSCFPTLKFIANRAKLEKQIQEGRRLYRPRGQAHDGNDLVNMLSEDDLRSLLKDTKSSDPNAPYPVSGSDSDSTAGLSRPGSPIDLPLGFNFARKRARGPSPLDTKTPDRPGDAPDSPSLSQRLSDWWSTMSPTATKHSTALNSPQTRHRHLASPPPGYALHDRPNSMFELRPTTELKDLQGGFRRRSRAVADDDDSDDGEEEADADQARLHAETRRSQQHRGGDLEAGDAGAEDIEEHWGDDEGDGNGNGNGAHNSQVQSAAVGLGLEGRAL